MNYKPGEFTKVSFRLGVHAVTNEPLSRISYARTMTKLQQVKLSQPTGVAFRKQALITYAHGVFENFPRQRAFPVSGNFKDSRNLYEPVVSTSW